MQCTLGFSLWRVGNWWRLTWCLVPPCTGGSSAIVTGKAVPEASLPSCSVSPSSNAGPLEMCFLSRHPRQSVVTVKWCPSQTAQLEQRASPAESLSRCLQGAHLTFTEDLWHPLESGCGSRGQGRGATRHPKLGKEAKLPGSLVDSTWNLEVWEKGSTILRKNREVRQEGRPELPRRALQGPGDGRRASNHR